MDIQDLIRLQKLKIYINIDIDRGGDSDSSKMTENSETYLVSCSSDGDLCVWTIPHYPSTAELKNHDDIAQFYHKPRFIFGHEGQSRDFAIDYKNNVLFTASDDKTVKIWSLLSGLCLFHGNHKQDIFDYKR